MENNELRNFGDIPMNELMHYGVRGQKWGIRRYQNKDGTLTAAGKKRQARLEAELEQLSDAKSKTQQKERAANLEKARQAKIEKQKEAEERAKKLEADELPIKKMTDAEIQAKIDRINLENRLKDLMKEPAKSPATEKKAGKGKEVAEEILINTARNIGTQTAVLITGAAVNKMLKGLFDDPELTINPKKGQKDK